jgi:hypothetical protein
MSSTDETRAESEELKEPSHDELFKDVVEARKRGIGNKSKPLLGTDDKRVPSLDALLWAARIVSSEDQDERKIEDTLIRAVTRLGGMSAQATAVLLGLTKETRGCAPGFRHERGAEKYAHKHVEYFRTRIAPHLLMEVATQLRILVVGQQLTEREEKLEEREAQLKADSDETGHGIAEQGMATDAPSNVDNSSAAPQPSTIQDARTPSPKSATRASPARPVSSKPTSEIEASTLEEFYDAFCAVETKPHILLRFVKKIHSRRKRLYRLAYLSIVCWGGYEVLTHLFTYINGWYK